MKYRRMLTTKIKQDENSKERNHAMRKTTHPSIIALTLIIPYLWFVKEKQKQKKVRKKVNLISSLIIKRRKRI